MSIIRQSNSAPSSSVVRATLATQVRDYLLQEIATGGLAAGDRVRELDLARTLGTSQTPVREALKELAAFGLLEVRPHVGTRVRSVSVAELEQAVPVRAALESLAARMGAPIVAQKSEALRAAYNEMARTANSGDRFAYSDACTQFHRTIVESAENGSLVRAWNALGIELMTILAMMSNEEPLSAAAESHLPLMEALLAGDSELSAQLVGAHVAEYIPGATTPPRHYR